MKARILKNMEWGILICCIVLFIIGCISLYSATQEANYVELKRQILWLIVSIPIMIAVICIDYNTIAKIAPIFYGIFIILLIVVLFTKPINGASSWQHRPHTSAWPLVVTCVILVPKRHGWAGCLQSETQLVHLAAGSSASQVPAPSCGYF